MPYAQPPGASNGKWNQEDQILAGGLKQSFEILGGVGIFEVF
jgi:hypothetical protein